MSMPHRAGPVVRPYAVVRGRTRPTGEVLDVIAMVQAVPGAVADPADTEPEHLAVLRRCARPACVADLASGLGLPLGVVRILLADLRDRGLISVGQPRQDRLASIRLLREVSDGLRRL